jgi:hypothetical protein
VTRLEILTTAQATVTESWEIIVSDEEAEAVLADYSLAVDLLNSGDIESVTNIAVDAETDRHAYSVGVLEKIA